MALMANPGTCLGGVPKLVKKNRKIYFYAMTYDCLQEIPTPQGLLLGHIGSVYNTIEQAFGAKLLSVTTKTGGNRPAQWIASSGNIPFTQVWLFPKFKVI